MVFGTFGDVLIQSFQNLWADVIAFTPKLLIALIIFIVGWVIAISLGKLAMQLIRVLRIDRVLQNLGLEAPVERAGFSLDIGAFIGGLVKWFFIIVFLVAAVDVLGLEQVNDFLSNIVLVYIPNVIVAAIILVAAALLGDAMQKIVAGSAKAAHLPSADLFGGVAKWAIWIFAISAALFQLGIAGTFIQTLFTGFVAALSLALGLSFGLGGKDAAARFLDKLGSDISER